MGFDDAVHNRHWVLVNGDLWRAAEEVFGDRVFIEKMEIYGGKCFLRESWLRVGTRVMDRLLLRSEVRMVSSVFVFDQIWSALFSSF